MSIQRDKSFVFIPADLAEEVEIPLERKQEILFTEAHLDRWTHYQLLGIPWNAPAAAARAAYLEKVKIFHPDRYPKRIGSYRARIERIFHQLTDARDELSDPARAAAYAERTAPPEERARMHAARIEEELRAGERRARLARSNPLVASATRVSALMARAREAMQAGRFEQAANDFLTVTALDRRNGEASRLAEEAKRRARVERARDLYDRAQAAEIGESHAMALALLRDALAADPQNPQYALAASRAAVQAGDPEQAQALAETALKLGPRNALAHVALGEALIARGQPREARRALERALELDPACEPARAQLRRMRWSLFG